MTATMSRPKSGGFNAVNLYLHMHHLEIGYVPKMTKAGKLNIQNRFRVLKDNWFMDSEALHAMIRFMYLHNPLEFKELCDYGVADNLNAVAKEFKDWRRKHLGLISTYGYNEAIKRTIPKPSEKDDALMRALDSMVKKK